MDLFPAKIKASAQSFLSGYASQWRYDLDHSTIPFLGFSNGKNYILTKKTFSKIIK